MRLLVTGGAGFLGARLVRTLLARGMLDGQPLERIVVADQAAPPADLLADARVEARTGALLARCDEIRRERGLERLILLLHANAAVVQRQDGASRLANHAMCRRAEHEPVHDALPLHPMMTRSTRSAATTFRISWCARPVTFIMMVSRRTRTWRAAPGGGS